MLECLKTRVQNVAGCTTNDSLTENIEANVLALHDDLRHVLVHIAAVETLARV